MNGTTGQPDTRPTKNNTSIFGCPESFARWYCLNGATCFSVKIRDSTLYNCWCPIGFHGLRCDYKYVERRHQEEQSGGSSLVPPPPNFPATHSTAKEGNNKHDALPASSQPHQTTKETHLVIVYNLLILLSILLIVVLAFRFLRRKGFVIKTIGRVNEDNSTGPLANINNNGQINQENTLTIEFCSMKQGQSHHHSRSLANPQISQESRQAQLQQQQYQTHWSMASVFTPDHHRRHHYHHQQQQQQPV